MEKFVDHGIFEGFWQYYDENGIEWRVKISDIPDFYKSNYDAFYYQGCFSPSIEMKEENIREIHEQFLRTCNWD